MKLNKLSLRDKPLFDKFLALMPHTLSVYAFENIYIWKKLFDISWVIIDDSLNIFFSDKVICFLYLPPLKKKVTPQIIREAFRIMGRKNRNNGLSRIENIEQDDLDFYRQLGYECRYKSCDYLCRKADLIDLKGDKFKSKRSSINYFTKHYQFEYLSFSLEYAGACIELHNFWVKQRGKHIEDSFYRGMLEDSSVCLKILLGDYRRLNLRGSIVKIAGKLKAFTFGFSLNDDTFCVLYETTDLTIKGLAQFLFRGFCNELKEYRFINIMDDSGLDNLKRVKLSYRPVKLVSAYIAKEGNA